MPRMPAVAARRRRLAPRARSLASRRLEPEAAAAEIQDAPLGGALADALCQRVEVPAARLLHLQEPRLSPDPQMLGAVGRRGADALGDLADVERSGHQQADDLDPGVLAQCPERADAARIQRAGPVLRGQRVELKAPL